ncbi:MAG: mechanosensitive ion channel family protein [Gemmatimonadota bacterium]
MTPVRPPPPHERHRGQPDLRAALIGCHLLLAVSLSAQTPPAPASQQPGPVVEDSLSPDVIEAEPIEEVTDERAALDEAIRNQLQAVFDRVPRLAAVDVAVDAGVVRLEGTVVSAELRSRAAELATGMDGVLFVDNRIRESTSLEEQLAPTWARLRELGYGFVAKLPLLVVAGLIVGLAIVFGWLLSRWGGPAFLRTRNPFLQGLVRRFLQGAVLLVGVVVALDLLDAAALVGAVVGTAGLAGLALGFAFKDIVENYLAGTILAFRQPFAKNDHIRVDTFEGKVVRLTPRETILMTLEGNHVRLPNALIFRSPLTNFTRNPLRRVQFEAGLGANDDLAKARDVAVETLGEMEGVLATPPPEALIRDLADSTVTMRFSAWVDQRNSEFDRVRSEAIRLVKLRLEEAGLTLPSPEYLLHIDRRATAAGREPSPTEPAAHDLTQADVSVDRSVDEQIESDRRLSEESDLLEGDAPADS